ncbi:MAG TPA: OmpH family outer membrane protein [Gemmatimonadales bacterium]|jgi:Skp family chaperone for outer membrane proteins
MNCHRKIMVGAIGCTLFTIGAHPLAAQGLCAAGQVGVVQVQLILATIPRYAQKDSELTIIASNFRTELAREEAVLDSATTAYQAKAAVMGAAAKAVEIGKLDAQRAAVEAQSRTLQDQLGNDRQVRLQPIEMGVQAVVDSIRSDLHCAMIFDAGSSHGIASVNRNIDLTQRVLDRINAHGDTAIFGPHQVQPGARKP